MSALYLNHIGMINCLGKNVESITQHLCCHDIQSPLRPVSGLLPTREMVVGAVSDPLEDINPALATLFHSRNNRLLMTALSQIHDEILALIDQYGEGRIAVVMASSTSGIAETEDALSVLKDQGSFPRKYHHGQQEMGSPAQLVAAVYQLNNVSLTISTACSSSAKAFANAQDLIDAGIADAAIVGGVDTLCQFTATGFHSLESISEQVCNPFSRNRSGTSLGEAATVFIVSRRPSKIKLGAVGEAVDAHHMSAPCPNGSGAELAINAALKGAQLTPSDIDYINLHGTATPKNDAMEAKLVHRIFGAETPCSSTKPLTGHTLGAAGATELGLCWLLLNGNLNKLPMHLWDAHIDTSLPPINIVDTEQSTFMRPLKYVMSNSFAFGGSNVSVILELNSSENL